MKEFDIKNLKKILGMNVMDRIKNRDIKLICRDPEDIVGPSGPEPA